MHTAKCGTTIPIFDLGSTKLVTNQIEPKDGGDQSAVSNVYNVETLEQTPDMKSGKGVVISDDGLDTKEWRKWPEAKMEFKEWESMVEKMTKHTRWGYEPKDLEEARVLVLYQAEKNGVFVKLENLQKAATVASEYEAARKSE